MITQQTLLDDQDDDRQILYIDGGCSGNAQKDISRRTMIALVSDADGHILSQHHHQGGSNNIAELFALRDALEWCQTNDIRRATIYTDSMNTIAWARPRAKVGQAINDRAAVLAARADIARLRERVAFSLTWLPRERNVAGHIIEAQYAL